MGKVSTRFEAAIILVLQLLLMIVIALGVYELGALLYRGVTEHLLGIENRQVGEIANVYDLQRALQRAFGGVLLVMLGLELLDTLKSYFHEHQIRLEVILIVAIIATSRHVILLDFEHLNGLTLIGIGVLVLALTSGYFIIKRTIAMKSSHNPKGASSA